jgi:excisionase family DNA binding protein
MTGRKAEPSAERLVIDVGEAAKILNISRGAAYAAAKRGDLPTVRIGGRILVPRTALMRLLEGHTTTASK